ncbi:putative secreted protein [Rhodopirellula sp. SWK7]|nr:putative secreted protein [Rhodopirellula sp. SWK7]
MNMKPVNFAIVAAFLLVFSSTDVASAASPGWSPVIIATGEYREQIKSLPIEQRPNRPFHFYGNTVRRRHYRGVVTPSPRSIVSPVTSYGTSWLRR